MGNILEQSPNKPVLHSNPPSDEEIKKALQELKLLPTKWEQNLFDKPWLPVAMLIPIGVLFLIGLTEDIYYYFEIFKDSGIPFQLLSAYFSLDVIYVSFALLAMAIVWLYQRFAKQAPRALLRLWENGMLSPKKVKDTKETSTAKDFLKRYKAALSDWKRFIFIGIVLLIVDIILVNYITTITTLSFETLPDATSTLFLVFKFVIFADLWFWILLPAGWSMLVTMYFIRRLPQELNLAVIPSHPDQCGGLKPLGDICLQLALIAVISSLVLAYWGSIGKALRTAGLLPKLSNGKVEEVIEQFLPETLAEFKRLFDPTREPQPITRAFANLGTVAGSIGGGWLFLYPVLGIHKRMQDKKAEFAQKLAETATEFDTELEHSIQARDDKQIKQAHDKLEVLQNTYSRLQNYPVWPISKKVFITKFAAPEFLTIVGLILNLDVEIITKILK